MKVRIAPEDPEAESLIPPARPDSSGIGVNYADQYIRALNVELESGLKVTCKRQGLKILLEIGDAKGEALMRRLEHGPDVRNILRQALEEAAAATGSVFAVEDGVITLEIPEREAT
ncbi:MAG: hypothetical protein O7J95_17885 [Planctomycetota bacterium]|nr:hypothetical protein [Planctomycetota bacterium]